MQQFLLVLILVNLHALAVSQALCYALIILAYGNYSYRVSASLAANLCAFYQTSRWISIVGYACLMLIGVPIKPKPQANNRSNCWANSGEAKAEDRGGGRGRWGADRAFRPKFSYWQANFNLATKQSKLLTAMRSDWCPTVFRFCG